MGIRTILCRCDILGFTDEDTKLTGDTEKSVAVEMWSNSKVETINLAIIENDGTEIIYNNKNVIILDPANINYSHYALKRNGED